MKRLAGGAWGVVGLAVLAFGLGLAFTAGWFGGEGGAASLPGTVPQSGSDSANGWVIEVTRATFSGIGVDVEVRVHSGDGDPRTGVVTSPDVSMAGVGALSARVRRDGSSVIRFPPEAWREGAATAEVSVRAVRVIDAATHELIPVKGDWRIPIRLPRGASATAARAVEALGPEVVSLAGYQLVAEAFRTELATVVRYELPESIVEVSPPTLRADGRILEGRLSEDAGGGREVWFPATQGSRSLTLTFEGLLAPAPGAEPWVVDVILGPARTPRSAGVRERELTWEQELGLEGPIVKKIVLSEAVDHAELGITLDGMWDPGPEAQWPTVLGDRTELWVSGIVVYPATVDRGAKTVVWVRLPGPTPPRNVTMKARGATIELPPAEILLLP